MALLQDFGKEAETRGQHGQDSCPELARRMFQSQTNIPVYKLGLCWEGLVWAVDADHLHCASLVFLGGCASLFQSSSSSSSSSPSIIKSSINNNNNNKNNFILFQFCSHPNPWVFHFWAPPPHPWGRAVSEQCHVFFVAV